jgi:pSer/pThr/pTyr-binding forkhead associated (FHA) protein
MTETAVGPEAGGQPGIEVPRGGSVMIRTGFYEGFEMSLDREWFVIGRGRSADMVIAEATISRAHAAIGYDDTGFYVEDLGSTNGTLVNGARIERHALKPGDQIQIGRLVVEVTLPGA